MLEDADKLLRMGDKLRVGALVKLAAAAVGVAVCWYLIEHRDTAVPALLANQLIVISASVGVVLVILAQLLMWVSKRFDDQNASVLRLMQLQIDEGRQELIDYKTHVKGEITRLQEAEAKCQRSLVQMQAALRHYGIKPPDSGWGNL